MSAPRKPHYMLKAALLVVGLFGVAVGALAALVAVYVAGLR